MKNLAPIVLTVYNRPKETQELINCLKNNPLAKESSLFVFSDAPKREEHLKEVLETRELIKKITGFKTVKIFEASKNKGLANSVIDGISQVLTEHSKVIVLEDDDILTTDFLEYMNEALDTYENDNSIWSVTAYAPPFDIGPEYKDDVYLAYRGCSWGWGTWKDRWNKHEWSLSDYNDFVKNPSAKKKFARGGNDILKMLELQAMGKLDSWAVRSFYSQFKHNMYTIYPVKSKITNIGFGGVATHCEAPGTKYQAKLSEEKIVFKRDLQLNENVLYKFKEHHDLDFIGKVGYFLKKHDLAKYFKWTIKYLRK